MKSAAKSSRKRAAGSTRKTAPSGKRRQPAARKAPAESAISDEEIRLRAYFIAEHRMQSGFPGDSESDWLEARRQLLEAAAGRA